MRYPKDMTGMLEQALKRVETLPPDEQDAIASQILESLDDEAAWAASFGKNPEVLAKLAQEALDEHLRGVTRPLDELIK